MRQFIYLMMIVAAVTTGCTKTDKSQQTTAHDRQLEDVCLDSARAIGERILHNDTIKNDLRRRQDVLENIAR